MTSEVETDPTGEFEPDAEHQRPPGLDRPTMEALGKVSEALEAVEEARGLLYAFHRLTGTADRGASVAVQLLREAGHEEWAQRIDDELVGRDVIPGHWTFQIVEEYDETYYRVFNELERSLRDELAAGRQHIFEAEMKAARRTLKAGEPD